MSHELVVTSIGAVGSFGNSPEDLWNALLKADPLARPSQRLNSGHLTTEIQNFNLNDFRRTAKGHRAPRVSQYALAAAAQAISRSNLTAKGVDKDAVSIVYGTGNGPGEVIARNLSAITHEGLGAVEPLSFQESVFNAPASLISIEYAFRGPLLALPMGWSAGGHAIAAAADLLQFGHASVAIVVTSDELEFLGHDANCSLRMVTPNDGKEEVTRPFDSRHNGAVIGEGGAALVLETREHAEARGAPILMELAGWCVASDVFGVGPKGAGEASLRLAMNGAIQHAGGKMPQAVYSGSYCTADADRVEARAVNTVFHTFETPWVSNIRGTLGEAKGVSGIYNLIAAEASLRTGVVPRTGGFEQRDPGCDINVTISNTSIDGLDSVMCNSFWVNGTNTSVIVRRPR